MNKIIIMAAMLGIASGAYAGTAVIQLGDTAGVQAADTVVSPAPLPVSDVKVNCSAYPAAPGCPSFCRHHHGYPGCSQYGKSTGPEKIKKVSADIPAVPSCACKSRKGGAATLPLTTEGEEKGDASPAEAVCGINDACKNAGGIAARHGAGPDGPDEFGPEDGTGGQGPTGGGPDDLYDGGGCGGVGSDGGGDYGPDGSGGVYF